jgi:hypothetical protein
MIVPLLTRGGEWRGMRPPFGVDVHNEISMVDEQSFLFLFNLNNILYP